MLAKVSLKNVGTLSREEWRILRLAMGKIRRFSPNFLRSKQLKLQIYRDIVRKYQQTKVNDKIKMPNSLPPLLSFNYLFTFQL